MKQEGLAYFTQTELTLIAMILFLIVFAGIVVWVYRRSNKKHFERMSQIPLNEDSKKSNDNIPSEETSHE